MEENAKKRKREKKEKKEKKHKKEKNVQDNEQQVEEKPKKKSLFDSDEEEEKVKEETVEIKVNEKFAEKYERKKEKEELRKRQSTLTLHLSSPFLNIFFFSKKVMDKKEQLERELEESSEEEDEVGELVTKSVKKDFLTLLPLLHNKSSAIYDKQVRFFGEEEPVEKGEKKKEQRKFTVKDMEREMVLEEMRREEGGVRVEQAERPLPYARQQEQLKRDLVDALNQMDEQGGEELFQVRQKTEEDEHKFDNEYKEWLKEESIKKMAQGDILQKYWDDPGLDRDEKFLREFVYSICFILFLCD